MKRRACDRSPSYRSAGEANAAIAAQVVALPPGTRGQSEQCSRCRRWHVATVPLTPSALAADPAELGRMCLWKTRYPTESAAIAAAYRRPTTLRAYACPYCRGWHNTKLATYDHA